MEPNPTALRVRDKLRQVLALHLAGERETMSEPEVYGMCARLGIHPMPPTHAGRVSALRLFAARVLPLYSPDEPTTEEERLRAANFQHWCRFLEQGDERSAAACALFMRLWSRGDSISLGCRP